MAYSAIYVTFPEQEIAEQIVGELLHDKLIACSNIFPIKSMYWWKEKINKDHEIVGLLKTTTDKVEKVEQKIKEVHPYDVPCIMKMSVSANPEYEDWIKHEVE
ncbi:divalent-cation tolerance protein CutA [Candidatus Woesearchaeota archaeon]|nr:divalent-cation tolerance protein CutA [Candidatus Woesearchaeota archaeon]